MHRGEVRIEKSEKEAFRVGSIAGAKHHGGGKVTERNNVFGNFVYPTTEGIAAGFTVYGYAVFGNNEENFHVFPRGQFTVYGGEIPGAGGQQIGCGRGSCERHAKHGD